MNQIANILSDNKDDILGGVMNDTAFASQAPTPAPLPQLHTDTPTAIEATPQLESISSGVHQPDFDIEAIRSSLYDIKSNVESLLRSLGSGSTLRISELPPSNKPAQQAPQTNYNGEQIMEGVFNGECFVSPEGKEYPVPPNYASKSKLVEGDLMKLTITRTGTFMYKQIGPVERRRIIGSLSFDQATQKWFAQAHGKSYKILTASVTFYRGKPGDQVVILVPESGVTDWGAVENIIST